MLCEGKEGDFPFDVGFFFFELNIIRNLSAKCTVKTYWKDDRFLIIFSKYLIYPSNVRGFEVCK